jgi:pyroglutamyl-peptidase
MRAKSAVNGGMRAAIRDVLVTGFDPFAGDTLNPSGEVARALDGAVIESARVVGHVLPCTFRGCEQSLAALLEKHRPVVIICLGLAGGRDGIHVERVAINVDDARIPDNAGIQPVDTPVVESGPAAYWSTLPLKAIVARLRQEGVTAAVSQTAGTFVCNHLFYFLMHTLATKRKHRTIGAGFVHVPWLPEQPAARNGQPSMPLAAQIAAVRTLIGTTLVQRELRVPGGAEH